MIASGLQIMLGGIVPVNIGEIEKVELQELLGSGGFGSAWRVSDPATGNLYVLKIIQGIKPGSVEAKRVEAEASVTIPSEHVVKVIGLCEWDASTYGILFDYFPGKSLDQVLEERELSSAQKKSIFKQILIGVADAHRCNIIHRDLKPANILVGDDGTVKLIDFGISKFKGKGLTVSGAIIGTMPYMAPELLLHGAKVADARADIYSLGHILYELAMGKHFWEHQGWCELSDLVSYLTQTPVPTEVIDLESFHCDFFREAPHVLIKMLKIEPSDRYFCVEDVMSDLGYIPNFPEPPADLHLRYPLLIVESGSNKRAQTLVSVDDGASVRLGRAELAGADSSISRTHLEFSRVGDRYFVRDLDSRNGTVVRGISLEHSPMEIKHCDRIQVGDVFLRFAFIR